MRISLGVAAVYYNTVCMYLNERAVDKDCIKYINSQVRSEDLICGLSYMY